MAEHKMPAGIKRVEKGVYRTLDDKYEVRQDGKAWKLAELVGDSTVGVGEFKSRGEAVAKLTAEGKLPTEAPKPEAKPEPVKAEAKPRPTRRQPKAKATATA